MRERFAQLRATSNPTGNQADDDTSLDPALFGRRDGFVAGRINGGDEGGDRGFLVVDDLRSTLGQIDLDRRHAGHLPQRCVDVFDTAVARHTGDPQGGDHLATLA